MIFKISPLELFYETCYSCENYKIVKKFLKNNKVTDEVREICLKCFLGEYSNYEPRGKHKTQLSDKVLLKESKDFKNGDRVIIGIDKHPRYLRYAVVDKIGIDHEASIIRENDGEELIINFFNAIKVSDDGLTDRQRLLKLYHKYFPGKWTEEQDFKYNLMLDECLFKKMKGES